MIDRYDSAERRRTVLAPGRTQAARSQREERRPAPRSRPHGRHRRLRRHRRRRTQRRAAAGCGEVVAAPLTRSTRSSTRSPLRSRRAEVLSRSCRPTRLDWAPGRLGPDGLGIVMLTKDGRELVTDSGPIDTVVVYIRARKQYGEDQNGGTARTPLRRTSVWSVAGSAPSRSGCGDAGRTSRSRLPGGAHHRTH